MLRQYCDSWGMSVVDVTSPAAAMELIRGGQQFDVALIDYTSSTMDGAKLASEIRALGRQAQAARNADGGSVSEH